MLPGYTDAHVTWEDRLREAREALLRLGSQVDAVASDEARLGVGGVILPTQGEGVGGQVVYGHVRVVRRSWEGSRGKKSQDWEIFSKCSRTPADTSIHRGGSSPLYRAVCGVKLCVWLTLHVCGFNQRQIRNPIFQY